MRRTLVNSTAYLVYRKLSEEEDFSPVTDSPISIPSLSENLIIQGTYQYKVFALNDEGVRSNPASLTFTLTKENEDSEEIPPWLDTPGLDNNSWRKGKRDNDD